ncbi:MAG: ABC transporter ATP-binding protein/permease [Actinomycetota bacterium]|nr:ABC transporter ATP-binding protein/permease [Actinomycetota bacterium]
MSASVPDRRRAAWRFIGSLLLRERRGIGLAALAGLWWQGAAILTPVIAAQAIDAVVDGDRDDVYLWAAVAVAVGVVETVAGAGRHVYAMRNRARGLAHVRDDVLEQALRLDARFHDRFPPGELMSRSSSDAEVVSRVLDASGHTVGYLVTVVGASVVLLLIDATLALLILAPLPVLIVGFWRYARRYSTRTKLYQEELGHTSALVEETVAGIRVVKGIGAGRALSERFLESSERVRARALDVATVDGVFLPALEVVPLLAQTLVLWFGGQRVLDGQLTLGEFVAFNAYVVILVLPLRVLGQRISTVQNAVAAAERIVETLEEEPAVRDPARPLSLDPAPHGAEIRFSGVRFGFDERAPVLDGFDLAVEPGASVALVGRTGSGKSTVAALLTRFYDPQEGAVLVDGVDVRDLPLAELRKAIALVAEDTYLFTDTVRANIAFGRESGTDEEIEAAARAAGAHAFIEALPNGYETMLGERGYSLSGGQRQRVAIARAILADPDVLVLDDATSSVDATMEHEIRAALEDVMKGRTTVVIAHRPATIALAERVVVLEGGHVVEEGTHLELLTRSPRYRELLALDEEAVA